MERFFFKYYFRLLNTTWSLLRPTKLYSTDDEALRHSQIMPDAKKYRVSNYFFISSSDFSSVMIMYSLVKGIIYLQTLYTFNFDIFFTIKQKTNIYFYPVISNWNLLKRFQSDQRVTLSHVRPTIFSFFFFFSSDI